MRPLSARFVSLVSVALTFVLMQGCGATPDSAVSETTFGAEITPGDEPQAPGDVGEEGDGDGPLVAVDDTGADGSLGDVHQALSANAKMRATSNVNLRKGAAASFAVVAVIPAGTVVTLVDSVAQNGFLHIDFNGTAGWSSAAYFTNVTAAGPPGGSSGAVDIDGAPSADNAIARAKTAVGFSYYWGGGAWPSSGATSSNKGSCSGNCPSCTHSGKYGADCSGLVAKAWQYGTKALDVNSHPYSTADFVKPLAGKWSTVPRESVRKGDSLVYNTNGAGHMVIVEKGDAWGALTVYECRGCAYGCTYGARSFASTYKTIRRSGF